MQCNMTLNVQRDCRKQGEVKDLIRQQMLGDGTSLSATLPMLRETSLQGQNPDVCAECKRLEGSAEIWEYLA
jgi:hypothetical protein